MADWGTAEMQAALQDQTSEGAAAATPAVAPVKNPQEYGWVEPTKYNYELYTKSSKELAEAQANGLGESADAEDVGVGGIAVGDWASNAKIYVWDDEYGDVVPRFPDLEKQLFGSENHVRTGIKFENVAQIDVSQEGAIRIKPIKHFSDAGLHPVMLENIQLAGYEVPTPIQQYTIPSVIEGHDLVACAQTGSGKTAAFLIPILSKLMGKAKKLCAPRPNPATFISGETPGVRAEPLVLIVAPCRELATQIFDEARRFCYRSMLRPAVVYGGGPIAEQIRQLEKGCDILIGTPGRLCDFINRPHLLTLRRLKYMVIDEADEMLNTDWEAELKQIMSGGDQEEGNIKYLMFSATFPKMARDLATQHLAHNHVRIHVGRAGSSHQNIKQDVIFVEPHLKKQALLDLLLSAPPARTIIFVNSKRAADEADDYLFNNNIPCTSIHADRTQREREDSIRAFRSGKTPVLIATSVSARGLDIHKVMHVINFDLPSAQYGGIQEYTHRIGRTGRIGNLGLATSFYDPRRDADIAEPLVKLMLETQQVIPDFLREHLPEGFSADDDGNVTGDFALLKFEDADEEDNE
ncbi:P-loop containing nucleoside triphosphate hydrolase protein [Cadophora sp. MPI-SDFR-AT-0126]|nr:P-loop containing nucleoside triphosphate hydrolase protein [Leotiomycetes sp. MPI-SDFR-AT-0126]